VARDSLVKLAYVSSVRNVQSVVWKRTAAMSEQDNVAFLTGNYLADLYSVRVRRMLHDVCMHVCDSAWTKNPRVSVGWIKFGSSTRHCICFGTLDLCSERLQDTLES
jgi:hypothetical protein